MSEKNLRKVGAGWRIKKGISIVLNEVPDSDRLVVFENSYKESSNNSNSPDFNVYEDSSRAISQKEDDEE